MVRLSNALDEDCFKTKVKPKTLNPDWNENDVLDIRANSSNFRVCFQGETVYTKEPKNTQILKSLRIKDNLTLGPDTGEEPGRL